MSPDQVLDASRLAVTTLLLVASPVMAVALVVGLIIALFQALTSIQEITLTFVPKIILVFMVLIMVMPFMADRMMVMTQELFGRIASGGG